jgi:FkbM family methyltransferase
MGVVSSLISRVPQSWIQAASAARGASPLVKRVTNWLPDLLRNREGVIQRGLGRGLRFNGGPSAVGFLLGTHDLDVQYAMRRLIDPGMVVYDIGANVGFTAILAARRAGPSGRVECFEPLAVNSDRIRENAARNGFDFVGVHQIALGAEDGEAEFLTSESPTWGRLARSGTPPRPSGVTRVAVRTLDAMIDTGRVAPAQFIKMDVEGGEADVLRGARRYLGAHHPVMLIELHHTYHAVVEALAGLEYEVAPLTKVGSLDEEFQLLAFPKDRKRGIDRVREDLAAGTMDFT